MELGCNEGNHHGPGPFCTICGQRIPEPTADVTNLSCSVGNHLGTGPFCTRCGQPIAERPVGVTQTGSKSGLGKKVLIGCGGVFAFFILLVVVGLLADDSDVPPGATSIPTPQATEATTSATLPPQFTPLEPTPTPKPTPTPIGAAADCPDIRDIIDIGDIPECIEEGEFDENSLRRVKVHANVAGHQLGKLFKIYGWDNQDRPINGSISVDHQETYDTMIRLGSGDWVNLSCYYSSVNYVEEYVQGGDVAYAIVHLRDCIDLK